MLTKNNALMILHYSILTINIYNTLSTFSEDLHSASGTWQHCNTNCVQIFIPGDEVVQYLRNDRARTGQHLRECNANIYFRCDISVVIFRAHAWHGKSIPKYYFFETLEP